MPKNKILQILDGVDTESGNKLRDLKSKIQSSYLTCWYPSSAADFEVIFDMERSGFKPDLFVYTDYAMLGNHFKIEIGGDNKYEYTNTKILSAVKLKLTKEFIYEVNESFIDLPEHICKEPVIILLEVEIWHNETNDFLGKKDVIYFNFENINFLDEILLKHRIEIDLFVKTKEGLTQGGGRRSIKGIYGLFSELGVKHILTNRDGHGGDIELYNEMVEKYQLSPKAFEFKAIPARAHADKGTYYNVKYSEEPFNTDRLENLFSKY